MEKEKEKKVFKKKKVVLSVEDKKEEILNSKMPKWQKEEYLERLLKPKKEEKVGIPFIVFAKVRKIPERLHNAMLVFPKAKGVELASLQEWDKIFKNF